MRLKDLKQRVSDNWGQGHWGASRGSRTHKGVDLKIEPGCPVMSPVEGIVTKLGYPYADDLKYRYVEVTREGYKFRVFYVSPKVKVGDHVHTNTLIGYSQDLETKYRGITPHIHFEIMEARKDSKRTYYDPNLFLMGAKS